MCAKLRRGQNSTIDSLVRHYDATIHIVLGFASNIYNLLSGDERLKHHIHTFKYRVKKRDHLKEKLGRKFLEANEKNEPIGINKANLHQEISDLAGVRLIHVHTTQIENITKIIETIFDEHKYPIIEGPVAHTWDIEYEKYYTSLNMAIRKRDSLYSSIHYVIENANKYRCEIQIRTIMDEVWGEVSHSISYPEKTKSIACKEQILVLARITTGGTRLVDSIYESAKEYEQWNP